MLCIATLFAALWSFACISARPGSVYLVDTLIGYPHNTGLLDARQSGSQDVPSQCKSTCDTPNAVIANVSLGFLDYVWLSDVILPERNVPHRYAAQPRLKHNTTIA